MISPHAVRAPYYKSLVRNMILTIIGVSFIPVFLVSVTIYYQFKATYRLKVNDHLTVLARKHERQIDAFLNTRLADIKFLAENFGFAQLSQESILQQKLTGLQRNYGNVFVDLGVINAAGSQVSYAGPFKLSKAQYAEAQWFRDVLSKKAVISDVFLGLRGLPHFIVAVEKEHNGEPWILRATIDFVAFNNLVESIRLGETGFAFIMNRQGELQTKPRFHLSLQRGCYGGFLECEPSDDSEIRIVERPDPDGIVSIYAIALLKNRDWLLVIQQQRGDAFAQQRRAERISLVIFALGGMSIVAMALLLSVRMVSRIATADREKELMNKQVIESGKLASLGELATGVAHEINNPVAIMVEEAGWIEDILAEAGVPEGANLDEIKRALNQIHTQGKRCKEITTKLLSFARGSGSAVRSLQVNDIVAEVIGLSAQRCKFANIEVHSELLTGLPEIRASETEMHQVFLNLINNAIYAMEKSGGRIEIKTSVDGRKILVTVADTGPGIPEGVIERIFDPFFTTKPVGQGTGLGLSICYGIIKKMDGDIQVKSVVGQGTQFTLELPIGGLAD